MAAGRPGPAVVVREARESGQGLGYARRERLGGAQEIVVAGCHRRAMIGSVDGARTLPTPAVRRGSARRFQSRCSIAARLSVR